MKKIFVKIKLIRYLAVVGLLVLLFASGLLNPLRVVFDKGLDPAFALLHSWSIFVGQKYSEQTNKTDLAQIVREQQIEINNLLLENAELKTIKEENKKLSDFMNFFSQNDYEKIMAKVISRGGISDVAGRTETITINKGSRDGLSIGLAVINEEGIVVGKISDLNPGSARVHLASNEDCRLAAAIMGTERTSGIIRGDLGLTLKMEFIPQSQLVSVGDLVISSGLEEAIPRGLVIGNVTELKKESNELWQSAIISSPVDINDLIIVGVLLAS